MNNYEKYEMKKHSSMKNQNHLFDMFNLDSDIILSRIKNKNHFTTKTFSGEIQNGINSKDIYIQAINSSLLSNGENNIYVKLSEEQIIKRRFIIESIKRFVNFYKIKYKIIYDIIFLFDILISIDHKINVIQSYEQIGLGSTILMIKYSHEGNKIISLNKFKTFYEGKYYPKILLKEIEILCLKLIDYYMNFPTPLLYINLLFLNGIFSQMDHIKNDIYYKIYNMTLNILEKIFIASNEYTKYNPLYLCCSIVSYSGQHYGIEKFAKNISKTFGINLRNFENIIQEFLPFEDNSSSKYLSILTKLSNKKTNERIVILKKNKEKIDDKKIGQNDDNHKLFFHHINKDIQVNKNFNKEEKVNSLLNIFKINNNNMSINLNYKTAEEMKNSTLFRKINNNYENKNLRELNLSNSSNNINLKKEINEITNKKNENIAEKKSSLNNYKTPDKIINNKNPLPNNRGIKYNNNIHHRNISNIDIVNINNINKFDGENDQQELFNKDEIIELKKDNNYTLNKKMITINKKDGRKIYKSIYYKNADDINIKINSNEKEKEEIKVRVKEFHYQKKNIVNEKYKKNNIDITNNYNNNNYNYLSTESDLILGKKDNENNYPRTIMNNTYKKNFSFKSNNSLMVRKDSNNEANNLIRKNSEDIYSKNTYINRLSSCNNRFKSKIIYIHNKEDDYSNETTSENSNNISIRRNYFRLRRIKDSSINIKNENITTIGDNKIDIDTNNIKENINLIKCNLKFQENYNNDREKRYKGISNSKIKDCLKIGSFDRASKKSIDEKNNFQSENNTKRVEIRSYYKLKNINKHF